ncbi:MAG: catalytic domain of component of various dehydrogenase complexe [Solirubrobacterales bacterium]|nr:catalytic domain of component of various dehydrogenase complexe [Solirubrobacterales bacterium]
MPEVVMPRLSDSMEEGVILRWLKSEGEEVKRGEEIVEIETDKATMSYEADYDGALSIVAPEGSTLPIGATIATIGAPAPSAAPAAGAEETQAGAPGAGAVPASAPADAPVLAAGGAPADDAVAANGHGSRVKASPVARRLARESSIDLAGISGSGPAGRIVKADIEALIAGGTAAAAAPAPAPAVAPAAAPAAAAEPAPVAAATAGNKGDVTIVEPNRTQQVVARRMAESKATVPDFTVSTDVDMEGARALRAQLKEAAAEGQPVPSFNDMVVKAVALALREFPRANGSYKDAKFELYSRVNVGVAVAGDDALIVPTVFDADTKSLGEIARTTRALALSVREGTIRPPELSGGTFTVSNLGMFGVTHFTAVVNTPQAGILAVGAIEPRAVVRDGEIVARHTMTVTLTCDHRILYGADAAQFVARVRALLEQPLALAF